MKVRTGLLVPKRLNWVSALWRLKFPVRQQESLPLPKRTADTHTDRVQGDLLYPVVMNGENHW